MPPEKSVVSLRLSLVSVTQIILSFNLRLAIHLPNKQVCDRWWPPSPHLPLFVPTGRIGTRRLQGTCYLITRTVLRIRARIAVQWTGSNRDVHVSDATYLNSIYSHKSYYHFIFGIVKYSSAYNFNSHPKFIKTISIL